MPTPYIKKLHENGYGSIKELEDKWEEAKKTAELEEHKEDYAYITTIFNQLVGVKRDKKGNLIPKKKKKIAKEEITPLFTKW